MCYIARLAGDMLTFKYSVIIVSGQLLCSRVIILYIFSFLVVVKGDNRFKVEL